MAQDARKHYKTRQKREKASMQKKKCNLMLTSVGDRGSVSTIKRRAMNGRPAGDARKKQGCLFSVDTLSVSH